jgi:hypothetical protein
VVEVVVTGLKKPPLSKPFRLEIYTSTLVARDLQVMGLPVVITVVEQLVLVTAMKVPVEEQRISEPVLL